MPTLAKEELEKLESCCDAFYGTDYEAQRAAHAVLLPLVSNPACISQLQCVLAQSQNQSALIFASSGLLKLITSAWSRTSDVQKEDTRKFVLNYLYANGPQMLRGSLMLLQNLVRLLCRIVKLSWLESLHNQNITEQVRQFLNSTTQHWVVGLTIYTLLTEDMQPVDGSHLARLRRTALSFRETALAEIFEVAVQTLQQFNAGVVHFNDAVDERLLLRQVLQLALNCLSFDFMGIGGTDDADDDTQSVMIPAAWSVVRNERLPSLFYATYSKSWTAQQPRPECGRLAIQCLVLLAAIRKSFFRDDERGRHISQMMEGAAAILETGMGLQDDQCYHEMCRLLGRINAGNQLWDVAQNENFIGWLGRFYDFTMASLSNWKHLPNSKHYIVGAWANMVSPQASVHGGPGSIPEVVEWVKKVTISYIDSRIVMCDALAQAALNDCDLNFENPLLNEVMRAEQLQAIHRLSRADYPGTCNHVTRIFEETRQQMHDGAIHISIFQQRMTWLVHMIASLIHINGLAQSLVRGCSRAPLVSRMNDEAEDRERVNMGKLCSNVFELMRATDKLEDVPEYLELAYLSFLEHFRTVYVGERAVEKLELSVSWLPSLTGAGEDGPVDLLNLMVEKILFNLKRRAQHENLVKQTLQVFQQSVVGVCVMRSPDRMPCFVVLGKLLLQCEAVGATLKNHQSADFAFLGSLNYGKYRTSYYSTLTKLLLMESKDEQKKLAAFVTPFLTSLDALVTAKDFVQNPQRRQAVIDLARDLRGVISASAGDSYTSLFNWLVDQPKRPGASRIDVFSRALEIWHEDHRVVIPILKFMAEFVLNTSDRISNNTNSPMGIFIFKLVARTLSTFGERVLKREVFTDVYRQKYKSIACSLEMFSNTLSGNYTNFGVFEVYNDTVLETSLALGLELCLAIPDQDLQAYIKTLKPFYVFLELATRLFMDHVMRIGPNFVARLSRSLEDGLCSFEATVSSQSCCAVYNIVQYLVTHKNDDDEEGQGVKRFLAEQPQALQRILHLMIQLVITGELAGTWTMSRGLLGLIILYQEEFDRIQEQLLAQQVPERRATLQGYFQDLMSGVERDLSSKNREIFTQNLYNFAQAMRANFV